ncbi:3-hydroxylacyl-ACP dehydratase [Methylomonas sp. SURF-2]|uniref:3-hydroxylacyl-ACP dehydratase n=1 Tax=Methylomonas subterranea TaxID=2952225 RepID=A0ABT1TJL6_9GAMM|nr:3-hydroxylacyl-ACP dehydratase [Methylomonas sp. SURF-2]MCQ8105406.1 3-hydroxylacyl-ACP dehydratase [Methylomonas sp. SURF-2]
MCPCLSDDADRAADFPYAVESLLPQSGRMVLIDKVLDTGDNHITVELSVRDDGLFSGPDGSVPAWVGMEYMAQAVAAYSGYHRKRRGQPIDLGFLLGTRHYQCSVASFRRGARLTVRVDKIIEAANDMVVFDCRLEGENIRADSKLNLLMPQDSKKFLAGKGL